jgi:hypothetical protein
MTFLRRILRALFGPYHQRTGSITPRPHERRHRVPINRQRFRDIASPEPPTAKPTGHTPPPPPTPRIAKGSP